MPLPKTKKILLVSVGTLAIGLVLVAGIFYSIWSKEQSLALLETELATLRQNTNSTAGMRHLLMDTKLERGTLSGYLVSKDGVVQLIESVEKLAAHTKTSISVNSVGVSAGPSANFEYVLLNAEAKGSFENLFWLLSLLEKIPQRIQVEKVFIEELPLAEKEKVQNWRMIFMLKALKLK